MPEPTRISLDDPVFNGRLRQPIERRPVSYRSARRAGPVTDFVVTARRLPPSPSRGFTPVPTPPQLPQRLKPEPVPRTESKTRSHSKGQLALVGMACLVFVLGAGTSLQALRTNHSATAQVAALVKQAGKQDSSQNSSVPSTTKPTAQAVSQYVVAADLPRYLKIPKLDVYARVMQTGVTTSGALGTPQNVFDTAWYTGSAKPGQPGATLIDGHVSSWTSHGVFYGIKTLVPGDPIQVIRGDGAILNYRVVRTQVYPAQSVDMRAAINPVTTGKPGLNLITCTGHVEPGTNQFDQRVIVFAEQV